jgi:hypothetical protein
MSRYNKATLSLKEITDFINNGILSFEKQNLASNFYSLDDGKLYYKEEFV